MPNATQTKNRRGFLGDSMRVAGALATCSFFGYLAGRKGRNRELLWQIDPDKCMGCGNCATHCVLDISAVKAVQCFPMCGYCDICTGYFDVGYTELDTSAENQLCPTSAIVRTFIESKAGQRFYEYTIDPAKCIGCAKCVKGCALMNGSLYMQVMHDRCLGCNECSIAVACPTEAFCRVPAEAPYLMKRQAIPLVKKFSIR
ncbi:MAG: 4Fe-4S binding protein [Pirellulales bacterium]|nr:4Fe-4S binding protein [Pirellulales bacterium]